MENIKVSFFNGENSPYIIWLFIKRRNKLVDFVLYY